MKAVRLALTCALVAGGCAASPRGAAPPVRQPDPSVEALRPFPGITADRASGTVEIEAWSCLDAGWLEQIACAPDTREHEALIVIEARPSEIHAALLLVGAAPGRPGSWSYENRVLAFEAPEGDSLELRLRSQRDGKTVEEPVADWIVSDDGQTPFPLRPWIFAGSILAPNPEWMEPGEHYVADMTGSIVGLVTFGDEVIAWPEVLPDQESVRPPEWRVREDHVPPLGTKVTLIIRRVPGALEDDLPRRRGERGKNPKEVVQSRRPCSAASASPR